MGTTLTGTTPQDTYDSLIKVTDNGPLSGSLKKLTDGLGNDSSLSLSTTAASFSGSLTISGDTVGSKFYTAGSVVPTAAVSVFLNANYGGPAFNNSSFVTGNGATGVMIGGDTASYTYGWIQGVQTDNGTAKNLSLQPIGGNVGIGISNPVDGKLCIAGATAAATAIVQTYLTVAAASTRVTADGRYAIGLDAADGSTERVSVTVNGLTFNGDTAAANALDDYEEGTWTMGISFGGGTTGITFGGRTGQYTKVGRMVTVTGQMFLTNKGSSTGIVKITGLPFTIGSMGSFYPSAAVRYENITYGGMLQSFGDVNTTDLFLEQYSILGVSSILTDTNFANNSSVLLSFTYFV
jgi:hypothetical protein